MSLYADASQDDYLTYIQSFVDTNECSYQQQVDMRVMRCNLIRCNKKVDILLTFPQDNHWIIYESSFYMNESEEDKQMEILQLASTQGNSYAMVDLAKKFSDIYSKNLNLKKSLELLQQSTELGNPMAPYEMFELYSLYQFSKYYNDSIMVGVPKITTEQLNSLLILACERKNVKAICFFIEKYTSESNNNERLRILHIGIELGHREFNHKSLVRNF
ncbi:MAG: hypothetical protein Sylvanvirus32_2 [Sylvanvirus sp.]|uniref:Uncharacterized protein n=1 Tax=Sylvanvirus sp. TaxID=2487774 RepID=A0A3G5AJ54_9VIRU|nr:MAG: hypothetical protein Sylvanvirus32_2 [Sylvanvirus sp.]